MLSTSKLIELQLLQKFRDLQVFSQSFLIFSIKDLPINEILSKIPKCIKFILLTLTPIFFFASSSLLVIYIAVVSSFNWVDIVSIGYQVNIFNYLLLSCSWLYFASLPPFKEKMFRPNNLGIELECTPKKWTTSKGRKVIRHWKVGIFVFKRIESKF